MEIILKEMDDPSEKVAKEVIKRLGLDETYVGIGRSSDTDFAMLG